MFNLKSAFSEFVEMASNSDEPLIELAAEPSILFACSHQFYYDQHRKDNLWNEIAQKMELSGKTFILENSIWKQLNYIYL